MVVSGLRGFHLRRDVEEPVSVRADAADQWRGHFDLLVEPEVDVGDRAGLKAIVMAEQLRCGMGRQGQDSRIKRALIDANAALRGSQGADPAAPMSLYAKRFGPGGKRLDQRLR